MPIPIRERQLVVEATGFPTVVAASHLLFAAVCIAVTVLPDVAGVEAIPGRQRRRIPRC